MEFVILLDLPYQGYVQHEQQIPFKYVDIRPDTIDNTKTKIDNKNEFRSNYLNK